MYIITLKKKAPKIGTFFIVLFFHHHLMNYLQYIETKKNQPLSD